jgi:hypothetical protein
MTYWDDVAEGFQRAGEGLQRATEGFQQIVEGLRQAAEASRVAMTEHGDLRETVQRLEHAVLEQSQAIRELRDRLNGSA